MQLRPSELLRQALAHHLAGRLEEARRLYARVSERDPRNFDALHLAGVVALQQHRCDEAVRLLGQARRLNPADRTCAMRFALALSEAGRNDEAEAHLQKLAQSAPAWFEAWDNLGSILQRLGRMPEAIVAFRKAVAVNDGYAHGWCNLGLALLHADRPAEALECQNKALSLEPKSGPALQGKAMALQHLHRIPEAVEAYAGALALDPTLSDARSFRLTALHYLSEPRAEDLFAEHVAFGRAFAAAPPPAFRHEPDPDRRLRVAFLSPDFREHAVAQFIDPILRHLDRGQFDLILYHDHFIVDDVTRRLQALAGLWRSIAGRPHAAVAEMIRADAPDILVDLAGHTGMNRLPLFAQRLAPVQISYLGYPDTTGLNQMDARLVDAITDPAPGADGLATEKLVRFSSCAWAYLPAAAAPLPAPRPDGQPLTFGCFNNPSKLSEATLAAWSQILGRRPDGRLLLKGTGLETPAVAPWFDARLRRHRIDPARVEILGRTRSAADHLALYSRVDVGLDPFPYNGTTTTCEALWMGVPVVTLAGDRHCGRVGASLLTAIGRPDWIAADPEAYVAAALRLAEDREGRRRERLELRPALAQSPLLDHPAQAARFGRALRECWQGWAQHELGRGRAAA